MGILRSRFKSLLQRLTRCDIERFGDKCFALIDQNRREDAWFSHNAQLRVLLEKHDVNLVIDAGANEGQFAQKLRSYYAGEIHSFKPVSSAFEKLAKAASSDPYWHVHQCALGSQESTQTINVSNRTNFSSLLKANDYCAQHFGDQSLAVKEEVISVRRLDKMLDEIVSGVEGKRIFLKMDTQGYDIEVFNGLGSTLKCVIGLQSEVSLIPIYEGMPHWLESISAYERERFGVIGMFPVCRDSNRVIEYDCLLIREQT